MSVHINHVSELFHISEQQAASGQRVMFFSKLKTAQEKTNKKKEEKSFLDPRTYFPLILTCVLVIIQICYIFVIHHLLAPYHCTVECECMCMSIYMEADCRENTTTHAATCHLFILPSISAKPSTTVKPLRVLHSLKCRVQAEWSVSINASPPHLSVQLDFCVLPAGCAEVYESACDQNT